ncbi:2-polyprenyl-6-methoxyphenol hydroxylase-like FAD-dependent oxidoreductase [Pedobacter cryoconitis]|uniref:FAD-dependent monooxygenase n=1 Tax=Pedobacter cryoconitis TaxID=188932 RepID=UPI00160C7406|nr:FAD-dependent monooxygenase [Pedobacter cryoconitis]MBB6272551.1 2-polyprenyl-6-methoxyphenol hydroxylase-like FAD-dependent oxidoreductase [Pedobacter cryoconitis]
MKTLREKRVLISGASFAGLSTAYRMNKLGYQVTVVEIASGLKKGGTPVNIQENTIDIVKRIRFFDQILSNKLSMGLTGFKKSDNATERASSSHDEQPGKAEDEIKRHLLLDIMFETVQFHTEFIFGESIASLKEENNEVNVVFKGGIKRSFDLVFDCDSIHSTVRKYGFGNEEEFSYVLKAYASVTIVNELLIPENTSQMYNEPGKTVMLNAYNNKTDIFFCFFSEHEISYDCRDKEEQRNMIFNQFSETGWRTPELLEEVKNSKNFYFDKLCRIKIPSWTKGRIALVGNAGYCASPAAGIGGSMAIDGAAALAYAFQKCQNDFEFAFQEYNESSCPFIGEIQTNAARFGLEILILRTEEAIRQRNTYMESL